jgi:hypothetical protein
VSFGNIHLNARPAFFMHAFQFPVKSSVKKNAINPPLDGREILVVSCASLSPDCFASALLHLDRAWWLAGHY